MLSLLHKQMLFIKTEVGVKMGVYFGSNLLHCYYKGMCKKNNNKVYCLTKENCRPTAKHKDTNNN